MLPTCSKPRLKSYLPECLVYSCPLVSQPMEIYYPWHTISQVIRQATSHPQEDIHHSMLYSPAVSSFFAALCGDEAWPEKAKQRLLVCNLKFAFLEAKDTLHEHSCPTISSEETYTCWLYYYNASDKPLLLKDKCRTRLVEITSIN